MKRALLRCRNKIKNDNKGVSLVELLVAIAIGAIVSGSIAALITISLRMYGKETADVEMQQEIQTTSNFIIDAIMESDSFIATNNSDTVILGKFIYDKSSSQLSYTGYVFCTENVSESTTAGKMYMKKHTSKALSSDCINAGEIVPEKIVEELSSGVKGDNTNLLATNIQLFSVTPTATSIQTDKYINPFTLELNMKFGKKSGSGEVNKELHDEASIRNTLRPIYKTETAEMTPVCIQAATGTWKKYYQPEQVSKADDELTVTTETYQMETALADIETSGNALENGSYKVLEIVPDYAFDYMQYMIGGTNGELLCNYRYYGNGSFQAMTDADAKANLNPYYIFPNGDLKAIITPQDQPNGRWMNNELFKLFVLQDYIEQYAPNNMLDVNYGIWDVTNGKYCQVNKNALDSWHAAGYRVELYICTPSDLNYHSDWIDNANMIVFGGNDGGYAWASQIYKAAHSNYSVPSAVTWGQTGGDLSWDNMKKIYNRVIENKVCIACPSAMNSENFETNINSLFYMLYKYQRRDANLVTIKKETYTDYRDQKKQAQIAKTGHSYWDNPNYQSSTEDRITAVGSGRTFFKNVTSRDQLKYIKTQYGHYTNSPGLCELDFSELLNQNEVSAAASDWNYKIYMNQLVYNNTSDLMTFSRTGATGLLNLKVINQSLSTPKEVYGDVEIKGVSTRKDKGRRVLNRWPWEDFSRPENGSLTYAQVNPIYQIDVVKLNNPVEITDGTETVEVNKVIYLNEYEYTYAKEHPDEIWMFCLVNSTADINTEISLKLNNVVVPSPLNNQMKDELVSQYKVEDGLKIKEKNVNRTIECRCVLTIPSDLDTKKFDYIKATAEMTVNGKKAIGTDYALVVIRDLFDLD